MFIRAARQAGMPALSRLSTKQNSKAQRKVERCIRMDASTVGGLSVQLNSWAKMMSLHV